MKNKVLDCLWNRLTKFSVIGFILGVVILILGITNWTEEGLSSYLMSFAIFLFAGSIFIEGYGIRKAQKFNREDAQEVYQRVTQLIMELRALGEVLHKDYSDTTRRNKRYTRDKRYSKLMKELARVRLKCNDYKLDRMLYDLIEKEKLFTRYRLNAQGCYFNGTLDITNQEIRNYINTRFYSVP